MVEWQRKLLFSIIAGACLGWMSIIIWPVEQATLQNKPMIYIDVQGYMAQGYMQDGTCVYWTSEKNFIHFENIFREILKVQNLLLTVTWDDLQEGHVFIKCEEAFNE